MTKPKKAARVAATVIARDGAEKAGLPSEAINALELMIPHHRYRLDIFPHGDGGLALIDLGLAEDVSDQYSGSIRAAKLNDAGAILRGAIFGNLGL